MTSADALLLAATTPSHRLLRPRITEMAGESSALTDSSSDTVACSSKKPSRLARLLRMQEKSLLAGTHEPVVTTNEKGHRTMDTKIESSSQACTDVLVPTKRPPIVFEADPSDDVFFGPTISEPVSESRMTVTAPPKAGQHLLLGDRVVCVADSPGPYDETSVIHLEDFKPCKELPSKAPQPVNPNRARLVSDAMTDPWSKAVNDSMRHLF